MLIGVVDLGIGNFAALAKMIRQLGGDPRRMTSPHELRTASHVILPGVGAFNYATRALDEGGWRQPLLELFAAGNTPVLCVCVGMQLLVESSNEGEGAGLGWISGSCTRFSPPQGSALKVPHMGWNQVTPTRPSPLFPGAKQTEEKERFYFVHSFHVECNDSEDIWATTDHGVDVAAAIGRGNVMGVQFHPEKSHRFGLNLLGRFLETPC